MKACAALLVLLAATPAFAQTQKLPFEGKWALKAELCATPAAVEGPRPVTLTADSLVAEFMNCRFTSVKPGGISWRVEADCTAQTPRGTERGQEFFTFAMVGRWMHWSWDGETATFVPCTE